EVDARAVARREPARARASVGPPAVAPPVERAGVGASSAGRLGGEQRAAAAGGGDGERVREERERGEARHGDSPEAWEEGGAARSTSARAHRVDRPAALLARLADLHEVELDGLAHAARQADHEAALLVLAIDPAEAELPVLDPVALLRHRLLEDRRVARPRL